MRLAEPAPAPGSGAVAGALVSLKAHWAMMSARIVVRVARKTKQEKIVCFIILGRVVRFRFLISTTEADRLQAKNERSLCPNRRVPARCACVLVRAPATR